MAKFIKHEDLRDHIFIRRISSAIIAREVETHGMRAMRNKDRIRNAVEEVFEAIYLNAPTHDIPTEEELEDATSG